MRVEIEGARGGGIDSIRSSEKPGVPDGDKEGQCPCSLCACSIEKDRAKEFNKSMKNKINYQ